MTAKETVKLKEEEAHERDSGYENPEPAQDSQTEKEAEQEKEKKKSKEIEIQRSLTRNLKDLLENHEEQVKDINQLVTS